MRDGDAIKQQSQKPVSLRYPGNLWRAPHAATRLPEVPESRVLIDDVNQQIFEACLRGPQAFFGPEGKRKKEPRSPAIRRPKQFKQIKSSHESAHTSSGDRARNTFFLLDQAQILSYQVQRTCQPACQSTRCWFIRFSHIRDVIRCVEKQRCCFRFRICTRCTRKAKGSATINHLCNMRRCL